MATKRNILGESADNGLKNAAAVSGSDASLDRASYSAPVGMNDQASPQTAAERVGLADGFVATKAAAGRFEGSGATGVVLGKVAE
jgi:hypothetical protein